MKYIVIFFLILFINELIQEIVEYKQNKQLEHEFEIDRRNIELGIYENRRGK